MKNTNIEMIPAVDIRSDIASSLVKTAPSCAGVKYSIVPLALMDLPFYQREEQALVNKIASEWNDNDYGGRSDKGQPSAGCVYGRNVPADQYICSCAVCPPDLSAYQADH